MVMTFLAVKESWTNTCLSSAYFASLLRCNCMESQIYDLYAIICKIRNICYFGYNFVIFLRRIIILIVYVKLGS